MQKLKIGIIGCGAIGSQIAEACTTFLADKIELNAVYDTDKTKMEALLRLINKKITTNSPEELFEKADLIVESATKHIAKDVLEKAIEKRKAVMIMSVGGLIESEGLLERARKKGIKVYLPSGAICGIDGLKAAGLSKINEITLTTRKPLRGLAGAPYLEENGIALSAIKSETILFEGNAFQALKGFPKNINVASILSLAGLGGARTRVRIITSPDYTKNVHEIKISGEFGEITTRTENVPSRKNPKTSKLAYLSAIATLKGIVESLRLGT